MNEPREGGGLRPALLPARLLQLIGAARLSCVHAVMDSLRGVSSSTSPPEAAVRQALAAHLPSLNDELRAADLVDHQHQDLPLAIFLLTHPALQRGAAPLLLLRTLAGWTRSELAWLYRVTPDRIQSKLNAGIRRIRVLRLGMTWPDFRELGWRVKHSIEVIEQLDTVGRNRRSRRLPNGSVCEYTRSFLEALARNPSTRTPWVVERWWRIRYAGAAASDNAPSIIESSNPDPAALGTEAYGESGVKRRAPSPVSRAS